MRSLLLTEEELVEASGGYRRPADQLKALHARGFHRAWRSKVTGRIVLERAHYEAVRHGQPNGGRVVDFSTIIPRPSFHGQSAKRARVLAQQTPAWADFDAIEAIYAEARRLSTETGIPHHVDHEFPLLGQRVSGLHVENNLRVIPARDNVLKNNRYEVG